jgi:K+-sensing histidine kinase KdpD
MESNPVNSAPLFTTAMGKRLADLSHDLKTPLTSLKMAIHLLQEEAANLTPQQIQLLAAAAEDVDRLHLLIIEQLDPPHPPSSDTEQS